MRFFLRTCVATAALCVVPYSTVRGHGINQITQLQANAGEAREAEENATILAAKLDPALTQALFSVIRVDQVWSNTKTLKVCFGPLAVVPSQRDLILAVEQVASEWTVGMPISFDFGNGTIPICETLKSADIRVDIRPAADESHALFQSLVGNESAKYSILGDAPYSMQLKFPMKSAYYARKEVFRFYVLHEFGHALGASHEHQKLDCDWNYTYVATHFGFKDATAAKNNLNQLFGFAASAYPDIGVKQLGSLIVSPYDRYSVMQYNMATAKALSGDDPGVYNKGAESKCYRPDWVSQLTVYDKEGIRVAYSNPAGAKLLVAKLGTGFEGGAGASPAAAPTPGGGGVGAEGNPAGDFARLQTQVAAIHRSASAASVVEHILQHRALAK
jgi:hypothetical protein